MTESTIMTTVDDRSAGPDPDELRADFGSEHPDCAAVEIWGDAHGRHALLRIECGSPSAHHTPAHPIHHN